ncbi:PilW family protein [Actimicrobium sp. CCI2.3]|uniref:PilW family protein n=1 Tax=Actimicrobium sp. CCI2.3 TaxID=3048616 RepID=UPI002AB359EA|nr:PilW family protein [Actimicrobium sp. CCI2.3]MDY7574237.1 PilW family protein [Actimicrobium sp. CCI2.3]MEB0022763.1 PilW family protein [Actimicrobium sp. CCI2.3]
MSTPKMPRCAAGFGLIEVMISITISLIVILAVTGLYLSQKSAYTTQGALSLVQEDARYLMRVLTHDLRLAGYRDIDAATAFPTNLAGSKLFIDAQNDVGLHASDALTLLFYGASDTSGVADGSIRDCLGNAIGRDAVVTQTYTVQLDPVSQEPSLYCTIGTVSTPLVSGVDSLQMLFVVDLDGGGTRFSYQPAGVADLSKAVSVLVSVVLRSNTVDNLKLASAPVFNHFGTQYAPGNVAPANDAGSVFIPVNDGRLRKRVTFSVALRNRLD